MAVAFLKLRVGILTQPDASVLLLRDCYHNPKRRSVSEGLTFAVFLDAAGYLTRRQNYRFVSAAALPTLVAEAASLDGEPAEGAPMNRKPPAI